MEQTMSMALLVRQVELCDPYGESVTGCSSSPQHKDCPDQLNYFIN